jgi:type IV pilus assembly protein PilB
MDANYVLEQLFDGDVVYQVHQLLLEALKQRASDIHIEPYGDAYRIRLRQDGLLYPWKHIKSTLASSLIARLKVLSHLDVAEKRLPQDGHFSVKKALKASHHGLSTRSINPIPEPQYLAEPFQLIADSHENVPSSENSAVDFRLSTCPTIYGEKVVARILNPNLLLKSVQELGLEKTQEGTFLNALEQPQGLILFIGPTGSGKTVSLYAALQHLNPTTKNILTIEDPVEMHIKGINQVNINPKAGLSFASGLRAFLRQDPDVIMVGEIRDVETAQIVVKAAQTGHLILSTLHAQSTVQALDRLLNLALTKPQIQSNLLLLVAQRLVRKLCEHCKEPVQFPAYFLENNPQISPDTIIFEARKCSQCYAGYRDRVGIFELLPITQQVITEFLQTNYRFPLEAFLEKKQGSLKSAALQKILDGVTSIEEITRVIPFF